MKPVAAPLLSHRERSQNDPIRVAQSGEEIMRVHHKEITINKEEGLTFENLDAKTREYGEHAIRFIVCGCDDKHRFLEVDFLETDSSNPWSMEKPGIFAFRQRERENTDNFNAVLIIPTGIGCEIGGHEGDGNAVCRLVASACDTLITHPNVVNATDYNEMSPNALYVEGSTVTRLLMGQVGLQKVRANRLLTLVDKGARRYNEEIRNAVSTARITLGIDSDLFEMEKLTSCTIGLSKSGRAVGALERMENLFETIDKYGEPYQAIALSTHVERDTDWYRDYFNPDREYRDVAVNPTGGIEAMMTHAAVELFNKPCAHAPAPQGDAPHHGVFEPRLAPVAGSIRHIHCVLKGLHKSPAIVSYEKGLNASDVSCVLIPDGCVGLPVLACIRQGIPVIAVRNRNIMTNDLEELGFEHGKFFRADNYLEAVGIMQMLKQGIALDTVTRPISHTRILK